MKKNILWTIFLISIFGIKALAQVSPEQEIISARAQDSDIKNRSIELERVKRDAYKHSTNEDSTLKFPEIKEDFEKIQKINSELFKLTTSAKTSVNYDTVLKFISEINRRAVRLNSNLFSSAESKSKNETKNIESEDIKKLLNTLDKCINSFAHNSIFQNVNVVNLQDSLKAQKDLETVINVSNAIKAKAKN